MLSFQDILNGQEMDLWYTCLWVSKLYKRYELLYHGDIGGFIHHQAVAVCVLYLLYYFILQSLVQQQNNSHCEPWERISSSSIKDVNLRLAISSLANQYADRKAWCNTESFVCSWVSNFLWKYNTRLLCSLWMAIVSIAKGFGLFQQLRYKLSLHFTPGLQSAVCVLHWLLL